MEPQKILIPIFIAVFFIWIANLVLRKYRVRRDRARLEELVLRRALKGGQVYQRPKRVQSTADTEGLSKLHNDLIMWIYELGRPFNEIFDGEWRLCIENGRLPFEDEETRHRRPAPRQLNAIRLGALEKGDWTFPGPPEPGAIEVPEHDNRTPEEVATVLESLDQLKERGVVAIQPDMLGAKCWLLTAGGVKYAKQLAGERGPKSSQ